MSDETSSLAAAASTSAAIIGRQYDLVKRILTFLPFSSYKNAEKVSSLWKDTLQVIIIIRNYNNYFTNTECGKFWVIIIYFSVIKLIKSVKFFTSMF